MARYDTSLADERGAVRADQHRTYRWGGRYGRDFDPRETTFFRPPSEFRGHRGGNPGSYGFGNDYDRVYRGGGAQQRPSRPPQNARRPQWSEGRGGRGDSYWGDRYGMQEDRGRGAGRGFRGTRYDRGW